MQEGPRYLRNPKVATSFVEALHHGEQVRKSYDLFAWVVIPDHVHVVMKPHYGLPEVMRWLKSATAVRANRLIGRAGEPFWQREYSDRWIRGARKLASVIRYAEENPMKAGLVSRAEDWRWSSAFKNTGGKTAGATRIKSGMA
jgi:REP element-mobilizing transposase RayT